MCDTYQNYNLKIEDYKNNLRLDGRYNGILIYINNKIAGVELLYNTSCFTEYYDRLIESYILEAIKTYDEKYTKKDNLESLEKIIEEIGEEDIKTFNSPGLGKDYRIENENTVGNALIYDDSLIFASIFSKT